MKFEYETKRLGLTLLKPSARSARQILEFYNKNRAVFERYEATRPAGFYTEGYQKEMLEFEYNQAIRRKSLRFWVYLKHDPSRIIGTICFYNIIRPVFNSCETGYKFDQRYWNRGYAREAMALGIALMLEDAGLHRIQAYVMEENAASIRLLESLHFQYEDRKSVV